jgi:hypothetical protein
VKLSSKVKTNSEDYMKTVFGGSQSLIRKRSKKNKSILETTGNSGEYLCGCQSGTCFDCGI